LSGTVRSNPAAPDRIVPSLTSQRMLANAERWCSKAMAEIGRWWRNDRIASLLRQDGIHRSVSSGTGEWEYARASVRDMASFGFLFSRLA